MTLIRTVVCAMAMLLAAPARAEVKPAPMFSRHMVLQRDMAVPIWGTAHPGEKVTVTFRDQRREGVADAKGGWMVRLDPLRAGGPDTLTVNGVAIDDVLVGEVWVGSGQSNMAVPMRGEAALQGDPPTAALHAAIAAKTYPRLRLKLGVSPWAVAEPTATLPFSALLFTFGLRLQEELDVPVGLMVNSVGGSPSGFWISEDAFRSDAECRAAVAKARSVFDEAAERKAYADDLAAWDRAVDKAKADAAQGRVPNVPQLPMPSVSPGELGRLYRQPGNRIGMHFERSIRPFIPYGIRGVLWDQGEALTGIEGVDQCTLMGGLIRSWRKEWGQGDFPFIYVQKPSGRGCGWDDTDPVTRLADRFAPLPPTPPGDPSMDMNVHRRMIREGSPEYDPWIQRHKFEIHQRILRYPNTAMVICSDLGGTIHPINKFGYGSRAARVALGAVYGRPVEIYGPIYQSHTVEGGRIRIRFTHVGQGLAWRHGEKLQGFAVAGADREFQWADAAIEGDTVVVSSPKVTEPVAARYAWAANRPWANLFNKDGLPALPFRTDAWNSMYWCAPFSSTPWIIPDE